jgi:hypothetical protein
MPKSPKSPKSPEMPNPCFIKRALAWGQKSHLKVAIAIFGKELTQIEDD